jgi:hypothetical protein
MKPNKARRASRADSLHGSLPDLLLDAPLVALLELASTHAL